MIDPAMPGPSNPEWEIQMKAVKKELKARQRLVLVKRIHLTALACYIFGTFPRLIGIVETRNKYEFVMGILDIAIIAIIIISALFILIKNNQKIK